MTDRQPATTGGCQCGAVRFAAVAAPAPGNICHCRMCQKATGNFFGAFASVGREDLTWTRGEPAIFKSSDLVERGFCRDCGTPLSFRYVDTDRIALTIGSFDDPSGIAVTEQYGVESRLPGFERLHTLPGRVSNVGKAPDRVSRLASRQHPDQD
jgi:hypothetical protein